MNFQSGQNHIDALLQDISWTGTTGQAAEISYSFSDYPFDNKPALSLAQQQSALLAMEQWSNVANINFVADNSLNGANADVLFFQDNLEPGYLGEASYLHQNNTIILADIAISPTNNGFNKGDEGHVTMLHEIGHALGLDHPADYGEDHVTPPFLPESEDDQDHTVMSYFYGEYTNENHMATGPMLYDIAAIQYLYGANHETNSSDDVYVLNGANEVYALWDGAGNDTLDASGNSGNNIIDLREGQEYVNIVGETNIWAAFGSNLENAKTGAGNDKLNGNQLNNSLTGGDGKDELYGNEGNDTLYGDNGNDTLQGNIGNDSLFGGDGADFMRGGKDNDFLQGNMGQDNISGDLGNDTLFGGKDNDELHGGEGTDILYGDKGNDVLFGEAGNDIFSFLKGFGNDVIKDFQGAGNVVGDVIQFTSDLASSISEVLSDITYAGGNATIHFDSGDAITLIGVANGALTTNDFVLV